MPTSHDLILLDLDGTISDPLIGISRSLNYALSHFGHAELKLEDCSNYIGPPLDETFAALTGAPAPHIAALVARYRERYADIGYSENVLYPGIPESLKALRQQGLPLAVCTSKRSDFAHRILEMFGLRAHFDFVNGGETGVQKWQQIEGLLSEGTVSQATVMVGDRATDIIAAKRNGLFAAGVVWGHGSRGELVSERPDYLLESPPELTLLGSGSVASRPPHPERGQKG